jgi:hypothetical protein
MYFLEKYCEQLHTGGFFFLLLDSGFNHCAALKTKYQLHEVVQVYNFIIFKLFLQKK